MSRNVVHRPRRRGEQQVFTRDSLLGEGVFEGGDVALRKYSRYRILRLFPIKDYINLIVSIVLLYMN